MTSAISPDSPAIELTAIWNSASQQNLNLEDIRKTYGNINAIRMLLKGDFGTWGNLFKDAVQQGDVVLQIQLCYAFTGMTWGKDEIKNFSILRVQDLESFCYYPSFRIHFSSIYEKAMEVELTLKEKDEIWKKTFTAAAERGYLPAFLELKCKEWAGLGSATYGFAVALRPFVGKGERRLDYFFGRALKNGSQIGSQLYYEGMYWMEQSCGVPVKYPNNNQPFDEFCTQYCRSINGFMSSFHHLDGLCHVGEEVVLAPEPTMWKNFVKEKLQNVNCAAPESYFFTYDPKQISSLSNTYKIGGVHTSSFIESTTEGRDVKSWSGGTTHGFRIESLSIYQDDEAIGDISVKEKTFEIYQTFRNEAIQPVIDFIENVMTRSGSPVSVICWLRHMGARHI